MQAIDKFCKSGHWLGAAPDEALKSFEFILQLSFPEDYRYFFNRYSSGDKNGVEIAGYGPLISDNNIVARTILNLRDYHYYPKNFIFFSDTGDGGQICFDRFSWKILEVYSEKPQKVRSVVIAENFTKFMELKFG